MSRQLDIVTITYRDEMNLLRLQARSLAKYVEPDLIGTIHIIVNDRAHRFVKKSLNNHVLGDYGRLQDKVKLHSYEAVAGQKLKKIGWRSQQILKLMASQVVETEEYLVLDCKNHFIRNVTEQHFFTEEGKLKSYQHALVSHFRKQFNKALMYLGADLPENFKNALPTVPPFLFKTQIVRALISDLVETDERSFPEIFMQEGFTEFYLYQAYLIKRFGGHGKFYEETGRGAISILASKSDKLEEIEGVLSRLSEENIKCLGVHREIIENRCLLNRQLISETWLEFGLISAIEEAKEFWAEASWVKRKRFYLF